MFVICVIYVLNKSPSASVIQSAAMQFPVKLQKYFLD